MHDDDSIDSILKAMNIIEPLSITTILEGMRVINEANLYVNDFISSYAQSLQGLVAFVSDETLDPDEEYDMIEMPALDHECTMLLTTLFNTAKEFCEAITKNDE